MVEVANAIKGKTLARAKAYLTNVLEHKEAIPIRVHTGGVGRHAQAKNMRVPGSLVFWPTNSVKYVLDLLKNAEANAEAKGLETDKLVVSHSQATMAIKGRRRTYRAHGRINPFMNQRSHVQLVLSAPAEQVEKPEAKGAAPRLFRKKLAARFRVVEGGGVSK